MDERIKMFRQAVRGDGKPERLMHVNNFWTWKVWAAGYKLSDALYDTPKYTDVMQYMVDNYDFDLYLDTGSRNPLGMAKILGSDEYIIDDEKCSIAFLDHSYMQADEYDELMRLGYAKFMYARVIPRRNKKVTELPNIGLMYEAAKEWQNFVDMNRVNTKLLTDYGLPTKAGYPCPPAMVEALAFHLRGIKGFSLDLRRQYDKVCECCDYFDATLNRLDDEVFTSSRNGSFDGQTPGAAFDLYYSILAHTVLNHKQFERLIWPRFQTISKIAEAHDKTAFLHNEGNSEHLYDLWQDLPKNRYTFILEQNDIFRFKKELPHITPMGGMPTAIMSQKTPEECVDYIKLLIDKVGYDGRFILSQDKMVSFASDCSQENLHAMCDFVSEFRY